MVKRLAVTCILAVLFLIPLSEADAQVFFRDKVVVLLYHDISDDRENGATISPELFAEHMAVLERDFNVVSLDDAVAFQSGSRPVPPNAVAITFDDGYRSNYEVAFPILKEHGWPATVFLTINDVGRVNPTLAWLTWEQITEMSQCGITFGSHSLSHGRIGERGELVTPWPWESQEDYQSRVRLGLTKSYQVLADHGVGSLHFAAPFGQINQTVKDSAKQAGFRYLWGVDTLPVTRGSDKLNRIDVGACWTSAQDLHQMIIETAKMNPPNE